MNDDDVQIKVVSAEEMPPDTFYKHIRLRHAGLINETDIPTLRDYHDEDHGILYFLQDHYHEGESHAESALDESGEAR
jgi:hypothetical protein